MYESLLHNETASCELPGMQASALATSLRASFWTCSPCQDIQVRNVFHVWDLYFLGDPWWHRHQETSWRMENVRDMLDIFLDCMIYDMIICLLLPVGSLLFLQYHLIYIYIHTWVDLFNTKSSLHLLDPDAEVVSVSSERMNLEHQAAYEPTGYYATRLNPILMDLPISWPSIDSFGVVVTAVAAALFAFCIFWRWLWDGGYTLGCQEQISFIHWSPIIWTFWPNLTQPSLILW